MRRTATTHYQGRGDANTSLQLPIVDVENNGEDVEKLSSPKLQSLDCSDKFFDGTVENMTLVTSAAFVISCS